MASKIHKRQFVDGTWIIQELTWNFMVALFNSLKVVPEMDGVYFECVQQTRCRKYVKSKLKNMAVSIDSKIPYGCIASYSQVKWLCMFKWLGFL